MNNNKIHSFKLIRANSDDQINEHLIQIFEEEVSSNNSFNFGSNFFDLDPYFLKKIKNLQKNSKFFGFTNITFFSTIGFCDSNLNNLFRKKIMTVLKNDFNVKRPILVVPSLDFPNYFDTKFKQFTPLDLLILDISETGALGYNLNPITEFVLKQKINTFEIINLLNEDKDKMKKFVGKSLSNDFQNFLPNIFYFLSAKKVIIIAKTSKCFKSINSIINKDLNYDLPLSLFLKKSNILIIANNSALKG